MPQDLASVRDLVADEKIVLALAHVALHEGETKHWRVNNEGHIEIQVKTHKHGVPITAVLKGGDDNGVGGWSVPALGTEVMIGFDGDFEEDAFVIAVHGSSPPTSLVERKLFMVGDEIHAIAPGQTAGVSLALKSDVKAVTDFLGSPGNPPTTPPTGFVGMFNTHIHTIPGPASTTVPTVLDAATPAAPVGTVVLKGQ